MLTRFADLCDVCGDRSEEYTAWPTCRQCQAAVCRLCTVPGTLWSGEGDGPDTAICLRCTAREHETGRNAPV